jgi:hypothetical protein
MCQDTVSWVYLSTETWSKIIRCTRKHSNVIRELVTPSNGKDAKLMLFHRLQPTTLLAQLDKINTDFIY